MTDPLAGLVTSPEQRAGLLVAVVTGGRSTLKQRPTRKHLPALTAAGFPVCWVVSDRDAPGYEQDAHELVTYPREWAYDYARERWMLPQPPDPDGFLGAFPGREWACLEAERRGCWGVLQLDDNIEQLRFIRNVTDELNRRNGGSALYADVLAALALSTNAAMIGAWLSAVSRAQPHVLARPGFPYSFFLEKIGPAREQWFGPYEDDITHALQYGSRADGVTAAVAPTLTYIKEHKTRTGMRSRYDETRAVQLQRLLPEAAKIGIRKTRSNGKGGPRVFHTMGSGAIRNPVTVSDPELYSRTKARVEDLTRQWFVLELEGNRKKVRKRLERAQRKAQEASDAAQRGTLTG
jgi:hypothetical protein